MIDSETINQFGLTHLLSAQKMFLDGNVIYFGTSDTEILYVAKAIG